MSTTGIVIGTIVSLVTIISIVMAVVMKFMHSQSSFAIEQAKIAVQLTDVQKELTEIKLLVVRNDEKFQQLDNRVLKIEERCKYIQESKEVK